MGEKLIYGESVTLDVLCVLHGWGFEFVVENGGITDVLHTGLSR